MSESDKDIGNVEAWAEVIEDMLSLVPSDQRAAVLELASRNEKAEREKRNANGGWLFHTAADLQTDSPGLRHWNTTMRLKSLVVQVFVRNITNSHSPKDAAKILFAHHRHGHGSRQLTDYLGNIGVSPPKRPVRVREASSRTHPDAGPKRPS